MDQRIYFPTLKDFGVYATRRHPRGRGTGGEGVPVPTGGIPAELNPTPIILGYAAAAIEPHADTERFSYTVPPKRRLKIQTALARLLRTAVGGAVGETYAALYVARFGFSIRQNLAFAWARDNTLGIMRQDNNNGEQELFEGDVISGRTADASTTTSTHTFDVQVIAVEYDAFFKTQGGVRQGEFDQSGGGVSSVDQEPSKQIRPGYLGTGGINSGTPII